MKGITNNDLLLEPQYLHPSHPGATLAVPTSSSALSGSDWSDASSQTSDDSSDSTSSSSSQSTTCDSFCQSRQGEYAGKPAVALSSSPSRHVLRSSSNGDIVPPELRQNPRRSSSSSTTRSGCPPKLVHQQDRKVNFVDSLVDSTALMVEAIWPLSSVVCRNETSSKAVLPLRTFIQETLKRSRTSYSTLQVTMYYLVLIKAHVPKHDFTMEQPNDLHASRALQCGRRIFLAALILASKYLQDKNYSARAWSKISGLNTQEINQNEMAFLLAINWKLHISDTIWQRWTKILLSFRPPTPPSPGALCAPYTQQCAGWKKAMMKLDPELTNTEALRPFARAPTLTVEIASPGGFDSSELPLTPTVMEPNPATVHTPGRNMMPAFGLLPTPKLTPQTSGFSTPAVSTMSQTLGKGPAMGLVMNQASGASTTQFLDRWPVSTTSSPQSFFPTRRSSLATSYSTASSPESMISDVSRSSRSSSISSASSLVSATTANGRLGVPSRFRLAKSMSERQSLRPLIIVPENEDYEQGCLTSSPEPYTGSSGKLMDMVLETPLGRQERDESADAARALQELHHGYSSMQTTPTRAGSKRSRSNSLEASLLQENVREILSGRSQCRGAPAWPETLVRTRLSNPEIRLQVPVPTLSRSGSKRLCCSAEASQELSAHFLHPGMDGLGRPGMWAGLLHD